MVKRKIFLCSESLGLAQLPGQPPQKYSADGEAIIDLLKNNMEALREGVVEIEAIGFGGKSKFMEKVPNFVKNKFAEYRLRHDEVEIFVIALRDADTDDGKKISGIRRKLADKIKKLIQEQEFGRVHIMFAVQAIEAWILADEQKLNEYLRVTNKAKRINEPEKVDNPKLAGKNFFEQFGGEYTPQKLLDLLSRLRISELLRCKHFKEFYTCVQKIVEVSA